MIENLPGEIWKDIPNTGGKYKLSNKGRGMSLYNKTPKLLHKKNYIEYRDINKNIGALVKKGLPQSVQQALDVVRVVGNKAVHPGQIAFDVDDVGTATMLMRLLNIIVERMITEPNEINALYQGLPESVKESIAKRDK